MAKLGKHSMFEQATVDRKPITVRICPEVFADIEALEQRLASMGGKLAFNRTKFIEQALREEIDAGNTGKSTLATHLLKPRIEGASSFAIESLNSGADRQAIVHRGAQYDALQEEVLLSDAAVVDIGSSNVDDFLRLMAKSQGSHEDFDYFVVLTMKEIKKQVDSVAMTKILRALGVEAERIHIVFNAVEPADLDVLDELVTHVFEAREDRHWVFEPRCVVYQNEVFERLKFDGRTVSEAVADTTDYRAPCVRPETKCSAKR